MPRLARLALLAALLPALGACDTFGLGLGPSQPAAPAGRMIDYRHDDLASLVFALDIPVSLRPIPGGTTASLDLSTAKGDRHVKAALVLADGDGIGASLPPPGSGRTYVMFGFAEKDKQALRAAQKWLSAQPDVAPVTVLNVTPKLCETAAIDPAATTFAIRPALPGTAILPLVDGAPIARLAAATGGQLPRCGA